MKHENVQIGVLEDDPDINRLYQTSLPMAGYSASYHASIADFMKALETEKFDLLVLDWNLPDGNAGSILQKVREKLGWTVPVVIVSAEDDERTVIEALSMGADDYLVKPVRMLEMLARIGAHIRRHGARQNIERFGSYEFRTDEREARVDGKAVKLTQKEFDLALLLFRNADKLVSRVNLLNRVWGIEAEISTRTIDAHVSHVRSKLELDGRHGWKVESVYSYGYRLHVPDAA